MQQRSFDPCRNSFHLLRTVLALLVILTHCYTIFSLPTPLNRLTGGQMNEGTLAVDAFLVVSGFLIAGSAQKGRVLPFLASRALRIFPALLCALLFTAFVVGPLSYAGSFREYLAQETDNPLHYVLSWLTLNVRAEPWNIGGVFMENAARGVNVPLWTIKHEVSLYLLTALLMTLRLHRSRPVWLVLYAAFLAMYLAWWIGDIQLWRSARVDAWVLNTWNYERTLRTGLFFFSGALLYTYHDRIPRSRALVLGGAAVLAASCLLGCLAWAHLVVTPFLVYFLATSPKGQGFSRIGDLSYGLYVYSYPVQQLLAEKLPGLTPMSMLALTLAIAVPLAALSWYLIEKPALSLKRFFHPAP